MAFALLGGNSTWMAATGSGMPLSTSAPFRLLKRYFKAGALQVALVLAVLSGCKSSGGTDVRQLNSVVQREHMLGGCMITAAACPSEPQVIMTAPLVATGCTCTS